MRVRLLGWFGIVFLGLAACAARDGTQRPIGASRDGGTPPANLHPCFEPAPFWGETGYEGCRGGMIHRAERRVCPSNVPRPDFTAPDDGKSRLFCRRDSDCAAMGAHAYCAYAVGGLAGSVYVCQQGCVEDAECSAGQICVCDGVAGTCYDADCKSDGDCTPGFLCSSFAIGCMGTQVQFGCQTPGDDCGGNADCGMRQFCSRTPVGMPGLASRWCENITCVE